MKTLFYGGKILTMEDPLYAEALLAEDEKILNVGPEAELRAQAGDCEEVNLDGAVLLPGFIDPHSHFIQTAMAQLQVSLDGADSSKEMGRRIRNFIRENQVAPGQWVNARDYDQNILPGYENPGLEVLDAMAPENPLIIHHKSGHMGLMNSAALEKMGITADTPSPEGGLIEKKNGKLTGYLEENAFISCLRSMPMPSAESLMQAVMKAQDQYASYGITTLQDGMVSREMLPLFRAIEGRLKLDVVLYTDSPAYDRATEMFGTAPARIKVGGMKIFLDGSPQGRTAWMRQPYEGAEDGYCGYPTMTDEAVTAAMELAGDKNTQLIAHCNGDNAAEQFLRCLKKAEKTRPQLKHLRPVIIHGQLMGRDQMPRAAELGAMVSFFIAHVYHWGDVHLRNFGKERASHISAAKTALKSGVRFTFHQDAPVIAPDMLETLDCAVRRVTKNGVSLGPEEELTPLEALRAVTVNGAYQYSEEDRKGSLAPGKAADFVILSEDPLTAPRIREIRVLRTYKNGECVYSRK